MKNASTNKRADAEMQPICSYLGTEAWWVTIPGRFFFLGSPGFGRVGQWDKCLLRQYSFAKVTAKRFATTLNIHCTPAPKSPTPSRTLIPSSPTSPSSFHFRFDRLLQYVFHDMYS